MRRMLLALTIAAVALTAIPSADAATPAIKISRVNYDPPGPDTRAKLNLESVVITNTTGVARSLRGWTIRDLKNHVYTFGAIVVPARKSIILHTGSGRNTATNLYWGSGWFIWNNTGDTATLRSNTRAVVHVCKWLHDAPGYRVC